MFGVCSHVSNLARRQPVANADHQRQKENEQASQQQGHSRSVKIRSVETLEKRDARVSLCQNRAPASLKAWINTIRKLCHSTRASQR